MTVHRKLDDAGRLQLVADAAGLLATPVDASEALRGVARLAVPRLADWCAIDVLEDTTYRRVGVVHADPRAEARGAALLGAWWPDPARSGIARVALTGERQIGRTGSDPTALVPSFDVAREDTVAGLGVAGYVAVPLVSQVRPPGILTLVVTDRRRRFPDADVAIAETLARMTAPAVAAARLRRELTSAGRRQDDVLATVSHELRTPLTAMLGWLRLARHTRSDARESARAFDTIERNGRRLTRVIDELIDAAEVLGGRAHLVRRPVDLAAIIASAVTNQTAAARDRGVVIRTELDDDAADCMGDRARLEQIVCALLANALRVTPSGGRIVMCLDGDAAHARIRVTDTGSGIPRALLPHVFEAFHRSSPPGDEGLGLNLAIVRALVMLHGGDVQASSGGFRRGATFTVTLPRGA